MARMAPGCICGKRMVFAGEGTCLWCGRGPCAMLAVRRMPRLRRLPWDLGAIQREGKRPDPHLENVVRLDRLRDWWKVPPLQLVPTIGATVTLDVLTAREVAVLALVAEGVLYRTIGARLDMTEGAVTGCVHYMCTTKIRCSRAELVEWYWDQVGAVELAA